MKHDIDLTKSYYVPVVENGRLILLKGEDGEFVIPAFTSEEEFAKLKLEGGRYELLPYQQLKGILIDNPEQLKGIIIDPFGEQILLNHEAVENIDRMSLGMSVKRTDHRGKMQIWQTDDVPADLEQALSAYFADKENVREAWLCLLKDESQQTPHWMLLIDFDGDRKAVFPPIANVMKPFMGDGVDFELMKAEDASLEWGVKTGTSFYRRKSVLM